MSIISIIVAILASAVLLTFLAKKMGVWCGRRFTVNRDLMMHISGCVALYGVALLVGYILNLDQLWIPEFTTLNFGWAVTGQVFLAILLLAFTSGLSPSNENDEESQGTVTS